MRVSQTRNAMAVLTHRAMLALGIGVAVLLASCAGNAERSRGGAPASRDAAAQAVSYAQEMIGKPYRYGGASPAGFDCSGLVQYSYRRAGIHLPRATPAQRQAATLISVRNLRPGDLLFFHQEGKKASHVGLYMGGGRFVHAPSSGKHVRINSLKEDFWKKHFAEARRI
jgi:murein DD-endopeptidase